MLIASYHIATTKYLLLIKVATNDTDYVLLATALSCAVVMLVRLWFRLAYYHLSWSIMIIIINSSAVVGVQVLVATCSTTALIIANTNSNSTLTTALQIVLLQ